MEEIVTQTDDCYANHNGDGGRSKASFMTWRMCNPVQVARVHWIPCLLAVGVLFFTGVEEYMLQMIPASSEPFDIGFVATRSLYRLLASSPDLNTVLAALNTVCLKKLRVKNIFIEYPQFCMLHLTNEILFVCFFIKKLNNINLFVYDRF